MKTAVEVKCLTCGAVLSVEGKLSDSETVKLVEMAADQHKADQPFHRLSKLEEVTFER